VIEAKQRGEDGASHRGLHGPAAMNGDSVERSSMRGDLKHGEVELGHKMEPVEGGGHHGRFI
jgi:hypothetical protein